MNFSDDTAKASDDTAKASDNTAEALAKVTSELDNPETRQGQIDMAVAIQTAIESNSNLVVQAGTGTGKSIAYLLPAVISGKKVIVATATKALQDQLAENDLPFLQKHCAVEFDWSVLKGRNNYVCRQRLNERSNADPTLDLGGEPERIKHEISRLQQWAQTSATGDIATLDWAPSDRAWQAVSVSSDECPGASKCAAGEECFAERARQRAAVADIVVVNTHLYGLNIASEGKLLPEHDLVIFDEAHSLEKIVSDTVGTSISPSRINMFTSSLRRIVTSSDVESKLANQSVSLKVALSPVIGTRLSSPLPSDIREILTDARLAIGEALTALRSISNDSDDVKQRKLRAQTLGTRLAESLDVALGEFKGFVAVVEGSTDYPSLLIAPLDISQILATSLWPSHQAILTSATIPSSLPERLGLPPDNTTSLSVESPFDYENNSLLYCAAHFPNPNDPTHIERVIEELEVLITAAGGRTLALFTSYRSLDAAVEVLRERLPYKILSQRDLPKTALVNEFLSDESTCLFATSGFFQGIDLPGRTLSLVTIDRIPFPRRDDPLLSARRDALGAGAFTGIDLPHATVYLAQAVGRLIRSRSDKGVVAIFDPRLTKSNYAWSIVNALPPMTRTKSREQVESFLREITDH